jgi:hypothetical protein
MGDTKALTDEQVLAALDFDHKAGSDARECPMAATFVMICRSCSVSHLACTTHYLAVRAECNRPGVCLCAKCKATAKTFDEFCQVIPIGGHS